MTTSAGTLPRPPRWLMQIAAKPANWLPAIAWLFLVFFQASTAFTRPSAPLPRRAGGLSHGPDRTARQAKKAERVAEGEVKAKKPSKRGRRLPGGPLAD